MGANKLALPWGDTTVLGHIVRTLHQVGVRPVVVVTRHEARQETEALVEAQPAVLVHAIRPPDPDAMLVTLQAGLQRLALFPQVEAAFVVLGDQPHIPEAVYRALMEDYTKRRPPILIPSYQNRRGHPWLLARTLWPQFLQAPPDRTLRDVLHQHHEHIRHLPLETPAILWDMDTPQDYQRLRAWWEANHGRSPNA